MSIQTFWTKNAIQTEPDLSTLNNKGFPTDGNPAKGIPPTLPGASWFFRVSQLFASVISAAGITIDPTDNDQMLKAMKVFNKKAVPIGCIIHYLGSDIPEGFLLCNGASLSRTEYPELFAVIGTKCGSDDASTFKIPNLHHRFLEGTTNISEVGAYVEAGLPNMSGQLHWISSISPDNQSNPRSGCLSWTSRSGTGYLSKNMNAGYLHDPIMNASDSNSIYKDGVATVQVASIRSLCLIRSY